MKSFRPIPGDPWPHDMSITVEDRPHQLLELLWLREAYALHPDGDDVPPLLVEAPAPAAMVIDDGTRGTWQAAWPRIWNAVAEHAGRDLDPRLFDAIRDQPAGSAEREAILRDMFGPTWDDEFGRDALDDPSLRAWDENGMRALNASLPRAFEDIPERRDLAALVSAWRAGLTKIVTIPSRGEHTRRLGPNSLLITASTREDSDRYRRALGSFERL